MARLVSRCALLVERTLLSCRTSRSDLWSGQLLGCISFSHMVVRRMAGSARRWSAADDQWKVSVSSVKQFAFVLAGIAGKGICKVSIIKVLHPTQHLSRWLTADRDVCWNEPTTTPQLNLVYVSNSYELHDTKINWNLHFGISRPSSSAHGKITTLFLIVFVFLFLCFLDFTVRMRRSNMEHFWTV